MLPPTRQGDTPCYLGSLGGTALMPRHTQRTAQQGQSTHPAQSRIRLLPSQPGTGLPRQRIGPRSQRGLFWYGRRVACLGFHNLHRSGASKQPQLFYYHLGPPCFRSLCRLPFFSCYSSNLLAQLYHARLPGNSQYENLASGSRMWVG